MPFAIDWLAGVTAIDTSAAVLTVSKVVPLTPLNVAVIVDEPAATAVASPSLPAALLIVAMLFADDDQLACAVRSCVGPAVYVPVAMNCCVVPTGIVGLVGVTCDAHQLRRDDGQVRGADDGPPAWWP